MTYKEYREQRTDATMTHGAPHNRAEYLVQRRHIEYFNLWPENFEMNETDYSLFDERYNNVIMHLCEKVCDGQDLIDEAVDMMRAAHWKKCGRDFTRDDVEKCIYDLYTQCLSSGAPVYTARENGISVTTDIYDYSVRVTFGNIDVIY